MIKKSLMLIGALLLTLTLCGISFAGERATPQEVYEMVVKAAEVVQELGEEALPEFNKLDGEFAWKDSYVFVWRCDEGKMVSHPSPKARNLTVDSLKCMKTGKLVLKGACDDQNPNGIWIEYWWKNPHNGEIQRKLSFAVPVQGTPYSVGAGVWNEDMSLEDLKKTQ